jgi:two-component system nitrate/nitrite response regulator NarL
MERTTVTEERVHKTVDILLVGEQTMFREGLRKVLEAEPGFTVVGDVSYADQALQAIADSTPDIVIVGLSGLPLASTMQTLQELAAAGNQARTILVTTTLENADIMQARQLGVSGILLSDTSTPVLFESVRSVAAGRCWFGGALVNDLAERLRDASPLDEDPFGSTMRELEADEAVVRADLDWRIACELSISHEAVRHHLSNVLTGPFWANGLARTVFSPVSGPVN